MGRGRARRTQQVAVVPIFEVAFVRSGGSRPCADQGPPDPPIPGYLRQPGPAPVGVFEQATGQAIGGVAEVVLAGVTAGDRLVEVQEVEGHRNLRGLTDSGTTTP